MKSKTCSRCGKTKSFGAFDKDSRSLDGYCGTCKDCRKKFYQENKKRILEQGKIYRRKNKGKIAKREADALRQRVKNQPDYYSVMNRKVLARKIGIDPDVLEQYYKKQFMKQQATCAICGKITEKLCIDHNHEKQGEDSLRGLLCKSCNYGIGCFKDNPEFLGNAKQYLINN